MSIFTTHSSAVSISVVTVSLVCYLFCCKGVKTSGRSLPGHEKKVDLSKLPS